MNGEISILIVDDEKIVRESLTKWFLEDGYRVGAAADANEALRLMQAQKWDTILLDIKMPGYRSRLSLSSDFNCDKTAPGHRQQEQAGGAEGRPVQV
jgi:CheY-like chemotaxis protein